MQFSKYSALRYGVLPYQSDCYSIHAALLKYWGDHPIDKSWLEL
jgi:hypothetical protein